MGHGALPLINNVKFWLGSCCGMGVSPVNQNVGWASRPSSIKMWDGRLARQIMQGLL
ncbi:MULTISPECIES: hypothetical protein [unclassified Microcoleus]|uniref:hypothetical protein n=1 Tax=unclassified Microcoleus TaxID=2642155 RepID=UPI002FD3EC1E